jgi:hypothetical protein
MLWSNKSTPTAQFHEESRIGVRVLGGLRAHLDI